jgi:hypothetical protein
VKLTLTVADEKRMLRTALAPKEITVPPARTAVAYVALRPKEPRLRGKAISHNFTVGYRAADEDRSGELSGTFEQLPTAGKGLAVLGALAGLGVVATAALLLYNQHRQKNVAAPQSIGGPPPAVQITKVEPLADGSVQIQWDHSPYGAKYVVLQVLPNTPTVVDTKEVTDPIQSVYTYAGLKPGPACFQVLVVGTNGQRSAPSTPRCATIPAPKPTPTPVPSSSAPTSAPASSAPPTVVVPPPPTGGVSSPPPVEALKGYIAVFAVKPTDDLNSVQEMTAALHNVQTGGVPGARLRNTLQTDRLDKGPAGKGLYAVFQDGFADPAAAQAACNKVPTQAPDCIVDQP